MADLGVDPVKSILLLLIALTLAACAGPCLHPVSDSFWGAVCSERDRDKQHDCACGGEPYLNSTASQPERTNP